MMPTVRRPAPVLAARPCAGGGRRADAGRARRPPGASVVLGRLGGGLRRSALVFGRAGLPLAGSAAPRGLARCRSSRCSPCRPRCWRHPAAALVVGAALAARALSAAAMGAAVATCLGPSGLARAVRDLARCPARLADVFEATLASLTIVLRQVRAMLRAREARRPGFGAWSDLAVEPGRDACAGSGASWRRCSCGRSNAPKRSSRRGGPGEARHDGTTPSAPAVGVRRHRPHVSLPRRVARPRRRHAGVGRRRARRRSSGRTAPASPRCCCTWRRCCPSGGATCTRTSRAGTRTATAWSGEIAIGGTPVSPATIGRIRDLVGIVFQDPDDQLIGLTVGEDVGYGPRARRWPQAEVDGAVRDALRSVEPRRLRPPIAAPPLDGRETPRLPGRRAGLRARACCCSTSPRRASIRAAAAVSPTCCAAWPPPSSSRATTWRSSSRSARGLSCSTAARLWPTGRRARYWGTRSCCESHGLVGVRARAGARG